MVATNSEPNFDLEDFFEVDGYELNVDYYLKTEFFYNTFKATKVPKTVPQTTCQGIIF